MTARQCVQASKHSNTHDSAGSKAQQHARSRAQKCVRRRAGEGGGNTHTEDAKQNNKHTDAREGDGKLAGGAIVYITRQHRERGLYQGANHRHAAAGEQASDGKGAAVSAGAEHEQKQLRHNPHARHGFHGAASTAQRDHSAHGSTAATRKSTKHTENRHNRRARAGYSR